MFLKCVWVAIEMLKLYEAYKWILGIFLIIFVLVKGKNIFFFYYCCSYFVYWVCSILVIHHKHCKFDFWCFIFSFIPLTCLMCQVLRSDHLGCGHEDYNFWPFFWISFLWTDIEIEFKCWISSPWIFRCCRSFMTYRKFRICRYLLSI